jgi:hypothetical protein
VLLLIVSHAAFADIVRRDTRFFGSTMNERRKAQVDKRWLDGKVRPDTTVMLIVTVLWAVGYSLLAGLLWAFVVGSALIGGLIYGSIAGAGVGLLLSLCHKAAVASKRQTVREAVFDSGHYMAALFTASVALAIVILIYRTLFFF